MLSRQAIWEGYLGEIDEAIKSLKDRQERCPGLLLTEEDLRIHLCLRLMEIFGEESQTEDGLYATKVHAEIAWYNEQRKLVHRPDITILEPEALRLLNQIPSVGSTSRQLPSKQFVYSGNGTALIFELKYLRGPGNPTSKQKDAIERDVHKIETLLRMWNKENIQTVFAYLVIFSKTQQRCEFAEQIVETFNQGGSDRKSFYFPGPIDPALIGRDSRLRQSNNSNAAD